MTDECSSVVVVVVGFFNHGMQEALRTVPEDYIKKKYKKVCLFGSEM